MKSGSGPTSICMKTSADDGLHWGPLRVIQEGSQPTAVFDSDKEAVILQYNDAGHNKQTVSQDLGLTWTDPATIDMGWGNATGTSVGPGRGIQLSPTNPKAPNRLLFIGHHG